MDAYAKQPWEFHNFTDRDDALGELASGPQGDALLQEIFQPGRVVPLVDAAFDEDAEWDAARGISDYIGDGGYHPDRTPVDALMQDGDLGLAVGYNLLAEGDDSYYSREGGLTY